MKMGESPRCVVNAYSPTQVRDCLRAARFMLRRKCENLHVPPTAISLPNKSEQTISVPFGGILVWLGY